MLLAKLKIQLRVKIAGSFYETELHENSQEKCRIEKVLKRKGDKLYVNWEGYGN